MKLFRTLVLYTLCKFVYRVKYIGRDKVDFNSSNLLVANHTSNMDGIFIWANVDNIAIMGKKELFKNKIAAVFLYKVGVFPIARGEKDVGSIYHSINILRGKTKRSLLIFPEGTRNARKKGIKAKTGAAYLAIATNANVVPIYIEEEKKLFIKRTRIIYGSPYKISVDKEKVKDKEILRKETDILMDKIYSLKETK